MFPNILAGERIKLGLLRDALKEFPIRQKTTVFFPQSPSSSNAPLPQSPSSSSASLPQSPSSSSAPLKRVPYCHNCHKPQYSSKHRQNCPASAKCPGLHFCKLERLHKPEIQLQKKQARENIKQENLKKKEEAKRKKTQEAERLKVPKPPAWNDFLTCKILISILFHTIPF